MAVVVTFTSASVCKRQEGSQILTQSVMSHKDRQPTALARLGCGSRTLKNGPRCAQASYMYPRVHALNLSAGSACLHGMKICLLVRHEETIKAVDRNENLQDPSSKVSGLSRLGCPSSLPSTTQYACGWDPTLSERRATMPYLRRV